MDFCCGRKLLRVAVSLPVGPPSPRVREEWRGMTIVARVLRRVARPTLFFKSREAVDSCASSRASRCAEKEESTSSFHITLQIGRVLEIFLYGRAFTQRLLACRELPRFAVSSSVRELYSAPPQSGLRAAIPIT